MIITDRITGDHYDLSCKMYTEGMDCDIQTNLECCSIDDVKFDLFSFFSYLGGIGAFAYYAFYYTSAFILVAFEM